MSSASPGSSHTFPSCIPCRCRQHRADATVFWFFFGVMPFPVAPITQTKSIPQGTQCPTSPRSCSTPAWSAQNPTTNLSRAAQAQNFVRNTSVSSCKSSKSFSGSAGGASSLGSGLWGCERCGARGALRTRAYTGQGLPSPHGSSWMSKPCLGSSPMSLESPQGLSPMSSTSPKSPVAPQGFLSLPLSFLAL